MTQDKPHAPTMKAIARIVDEMIHEFEPHPDHPGQRWGEFSNRITAALSPPVRQEGGDGLISRLRAYARDIGNGPVTDDLMLAAAELRIRELEAADVQRVRDISRLTEERDAAREALSGSSSTAAGMVVVPRDLLHRIVALDECEAHFEDAFERLLPELRAITGENNG